MSNVISYTSKKGTPVELRLTQHAFSRFKERWAYVFPNAEVPDNIVGWIAHQFATHVERVKNLNRKEKARVKKHKGATLFFKGMGFTYVVQGNDIITIELSDKGKRKFNKPEQVKLS